MFDLARVGKQIKKYRIAADMTQMELAEKMGISFQAVSSWERNETMPDISRMTELAELFHITVDELLDYQDKAKCVEMLMHPQEQEISVKELQELEGIVKPSDVRKYKIKIESVEDIIYLAPFVGREMITEMAGNHKELLTQVEMLILIAPFIERKLMDELVEENLGKFTSIQELVSIVPFISRKTASQAAQLFADQNLTLEDIVSIAPFVNRDIVDKMVIACQHNIKNMQDIIPLAPFVSRDMLQQILNR